MPHIEDTLERIALLGPPNLVHFLRAVEFRHRIGQNRSEEAAARNSTEELTVSYR